MTNYIYPSGDKIKVKMLKNYWLDKSIERIVENVLDQHALYYFDDSNNDFTQMHVVVSPPCNVGGVTVTTPCGVDPASSSDSTCYWCHFDGVNRGYIPNIAEIFNTNLGKGQ